MSHPTERVRVTISLSRELANQIDGLVDGVRIRNRSHAIETLVTDSLDLVQVKQAVILAGGENALNRVPIIQSTLDIFRLYGVFSVHIATGFLGEELKKAIGSGEVNGLQIQYSQSELGTGGALLQLQTKLKETFLVANLDQAVDIDLKNLLRFHREHQAIATIATKSLRELTGIYVLEPDVFSSIPKGFCTLEDTVFHELSTQGKLLSYPILKSKT